jgi:asparagine synthase (glutamine-hydrolysing)
MSAIAGIVRFDDKAPSALELKLVTNVLQAYGPDQSNIVVIGRVGMVNLLMRMTHEDKFDTQPWQSASGAFITADARLDNREVVLSRIGIRSGEADTWSDSRVILTAWDLLGNRLWPILRGPFAVAIWEPRSAALTLARDHLGVNVVMFYMSQRFFAFASMPKGVFAFKDVPRRLNEEKFADFLVLNHSDQGTTMYQGINRVLPAHFLTLGRNGAMSQHRYWSAADIAPIHLPTDEAYADGLRERLQLAVDRQMRTPHKIGCFLSGGLDSSSVATLAARRLKEKGARLHAYTQIPRYGFEGASRQGLYLDERPYVEEIVKRNANIDVSWVTNDSCDDFACLERMFSALDGPVRNTMTLGWMLAILEMAQARGHRVMLTGRHGNFAASWDGWSQTADHLLHGRLLKVYRQWRLFYQTSSLSRWESWWKLVLEPLVPSEILRFNLRDGKTGRIPPWQKYSPIKPDFAIAMGVESRARRLGHDFSYRWQPETRMDAVKLADFDGDWIQAVKGLTGVEVRDPAADLDLISYCLAIPPDQFLAEGIDRSLIRRAMWNFLPERVLTNRARGVQSADWYEKLRSRCEVLLSEVGALVESPLGKRCIDLARLKRALDNWPSDEGCTNKTAREYRFVVARGVSAGRFLAWLESCGS